MKKLVTILSLMTILFTSSVFANDCNVKTTSGDKGLYLNNTKVGHWKPWYRLNSLLEEAVQMKKQNYCQTVKLNGFDTKDLTCLIHGYPNKSLSIGNFEVVSWNPVTGMSGLMNSAKRFMELELCKTISAP